MGYKLASGISFGVLAGHAIVLDLCRDRYRQLGVRTTNTLLSLQRGEATDLVSLQTLLVTGIIEQGYAPSHIMPVKLEMPRASAIEVDDLICPAQPGRIAVASALLSTRLRLRFHGLHSTVLRAQAMRDASGLASRPDLAVSIAQAFARYRTGVPVARACVSDSLALSQLLCAAGVSHDVVFGARLEPFAAHAWVQIDSHVLSDNADPVASHLAVFKL